MLNMMTATDNTEFAPFAHSFGILRDGKTLQVLWRRDCSPAGVSRFVELYQNRFGVRLSFLDVGKHHFSFWAVA